MELMMSAYNHEAITRELPEEISVRRKEWWRHFKFWRRFFFTVGTLGATVSAVAATDVLGLSPYLAAAAAVCFAVLGFTHPERNYLQYVRAWRILDVACKRYEYDHGSLKGLMDAVEQGERVIAELEYTLESTQWKNGAPQTNPSRQVVNPIAPASAAEYARTIPGARRASRRNEAPLDS